MKDSKYFKINEFKCKCGKCELPNDFPSDELVENLETIREYFDKPLIINSAYRCKEHNDKVGGSPNSQHVKGKAVDFTIKGVKTKDVYSYVIRKFGDYNYGIAIKNSPDEYKGFVHLDVRGDKKARWEYK